jgi:hypothetical protein
MVEQSDRHLFVAAYDGLVKGGKAGSGGVRVGALSQQKFHEIPKAGVSGKNGGADAPRIGIVHVGARMNQQFGSFTIVPIARPMQGGRAVPRSRVDVCFFLQKRAQGIPVAGFGGVNQGGALAAGPDNATGPYNEYGKRQRDQAVRSRGRLHRS